MLKKYLTCKTHLKAFDDFKVVARLDTDDYNNTNTIVTETTDRDIATALEIPVRIVRERSHYLVGEIADRLYEYEQLGYSPEELKKFIEEHKRHEAINESMKQCMSFKGKHLYVMPGRCNGKSLRSAQILLEHCLEHDIDPISSLYPSMMIVPQSHHTYKHTGKYPLGTSIPQINNVIFNDPATIVFWDDGSKTVVKTQNGDEYDPEKGLAMAISKKALGNKRDYYHVFKKWLKKYVPNSRLIFKATSSVGDSCAKATNGLKKLADVLRGE